MSELPDIKIDTKGFGEPLTKLVECVAKGIGKFYEPRGIVRKARADAQAKMILAEAEDELAIRTVHRLAYVEMRRQANIESIFEQAKGRLPATVSSEPVSEDWIHQFFEDCKDISDKEMQALWAHILAGEVANPRTFSRRTLQLLRTFEQQDAVAFAQYCSVAFLHPCESHFTFQNDATLAALDQMASSAIESHLITLGLLAADTTFYDLFKLENWKIRYFDKEFTFAMNPALRLSTPFYTPPLGLIFRFFTSMGEELLPVVTTKPIPNFLQKQTEEFAKLKIGLNYSDGFC